MSSATPLAPVERPASAEIVVPVYRVQLQWTGSVLTESGRCQTAQDAAAIVRRYLGEPDREHFIAIYLDANYTIIGIHTVSIGGRSSVSMTAAEIFKPGLLCNATGVTLVHNHPSGLPNPSRADKILTSELEIAGVLIGIQLIDHVILGHTNAVSMREAGLLVVPVAGDFNCDEVLKGTARRVRRDRK